MRDSRRFFKKWAAPLAGLLLLGSSCTVGGSATTVTAQDIRGLLQSVQGNELIVSLGDGTQVRIQADTAKTAEEAQKLLGEQVTVKTDSPAGSHVAVSVGRRGSSGNQQALGNIDYITAKTFTINGKTVSVDTNTMLDSGLGLHVRVRVDFITLNDGIQLATEIRPAEDGFRFTGPIDKKDANSIAVDGKNFQTNPTTRLEPGLKPGDTVNVKFIRLSNNSLMATEVVADTSGDNMKIMRFAGKFVSSNEQSVVIGSETFKANETTKIASDVHPGNNARVILETQSDGSLLAIKVISDEIGATTGDTTANGDLTTITADKLTVGGSTFKIGPATKLDNGLAAGAAVKVEFVNLPDGSKLATHVEGNTDNTKMSGTLTGMSSDSFTIDGKTFTVNAATRIDPGLLTGAAVRVESVTLSDGTVLATAIETAPQGSGASGGDSRGDNRGGSQSGGGSNGGGQQPGGNGGGGSPTPRPSGSPTLRPSTTPTPTRPPTPLPTSPKPTAPTPTASPSPSPTPSGGGGGSTDDGGGRINTGGGDVKH